MWGSHSLRYCLNSTHVSLMSYLFPPSEQLHVMFYHRTIFGPCSLILSSSPFPPSLSFSPISLLSSSHSPCLTVCETLAHCQFGCTTPLTSSPLWLLWQIIHSHTQTNTHTQPINLNSSEGTGIDFSLVSWQSCAHSLEISNTKHGDSAHIKLHQSTATLPFDHLRIVQIDLHEVLLLGMVAIERPGRKRADWKDTWAYCTDICIIHSTLEAFLPWHHAEHWNGCSANTLRTF